MTRYFSLDGRLLTLGEQLGKGGEGSVFAVTDPDLCAKIYHKPLTPERSEKLRAMASMSSDALTKLTAWPLGLVSNENHEPIGLIIPRVTGSKDVHKLYGPKSRRAEFARADWRFLIRAAANISRAFGAVHAAGCVIGDVNHGSVLVAQDATVRLIDCDSFQVQATGRHFLCDVGVETYTPPELQGRPFTGLIRSADHDVFGLAVLAFHLLMMGRHPYSGRYLGSEDMPIARAIAEKRFAYGARRAQLRMDRPPGAPTLDVLGPEVEALFEKAFSSQAAMDGRPSARDWIAGLSTLERAVRQCSSNQAHWYHRAQPSCPWCRIEGATGLTLFPLVLQATQQGTLDLENLFAQVAALGHPGPAPQLSEPKLKASAEALNLRLHKKKRNFTAFMAAVGCFVPLLATGVVPAAVFVAPLVFFVVRQMMDRSSRVAAVKEALADAARKKAIALQDWNRSAGSQSFDEKRGDFDSAVKAVKSIPALRESKLTQLRDDRRRLQLEAFLDQFDLESAKIPGIGAGRKTQLASHNVETAADVTSFSIKIPGFGPTIQAKLLAWRGTLERGFAFDPTRPIDQRNLMQLEQAIYSERVKAEDKVRAAFASLRQEHARILSVREHMRPQVEAALKVHAQAAADAAAVG